MSPRRTSLLLVVALALTGFSLRTAVTSVGAVLGEIESGLHASSGLSGLLTTLPVVCFAGLGALTPAAAARFGPHRLLVLALVLSAAGLFARSVVGSIGLFLVLSVFALGGAAIGNVLLPTLVKEHFPNRIGAMTALYSTSLAVGTTAGAGLTVPVASVGGSWRVGLGVWSVFALAAALPWLTTLGHDRAAAVDGPRRLSAGALIRSRTAWVLTIFFAAQSVQAYVAFGWFARFMTAHGVGEATAGWMVALLSAVGIPMSMIAPNIPVRLHRALLLVLVGSYVVAYAGLGLAPRDGAWFWMVLAGIGSGMFPLALTMIGLRSRTSATTAALSAFVQAIGYIVAGSGPLFFGVLYGATGGWFLPLLLLWTALAVALVSGWMACAERYVDDELVTSGG